VKILALNPGSTSLKIGLFDEHVKDLPGFKNLAGLDWQAISHVGVRVVHGGSEFTGLTKIDDKVLTKLEELSALAPLHNPPAIKLIKQIRKEQPQIPIWAAFDTAFHTTIPEEIALYPLPKAVSTKLKIRKYGFHGLACQSLLRQIKNPPTRIVICHLGGGCSITAVKNGKSVNTSMGFTPQEGLMMVSRSGTIDAGIFVYLKQQLKLSDEACLQLLSQQSGFAGVAGSNDIKKVLAENELAKAMFIHRICEYIFAYHGQLSGIDLLIFSGGIGYHNQALRQEILAKLKTIKIGNVQVMQAQENREIAQQIIINQK